MKSKVYALFALFVEELKRISADDGFWTEGDWTYTYTPSPTPKGQKIKARIYQDGERLELEGDFNENRAADGSRTPVVYKRK